MQAQRKAMMTTEEATTFDRFSMSNAAMASKESIGGVIMDTAVAELDALQRWGRLLQQQDQPQDWLVYHGQASMGRKPFLRVYNMTGLPAHQFVAARYRLSTVSIRPMGYAIGEYGRRQLERAGYVEVPDSWKV
jgi:hypothetical protein